MIRVASLPEHHRTRPSHIHTASRPIGRREEDRADSGCRLRRLQLVAHLFCYAPISLGALIVAGKRRVNTSIANIRKHVLGCYLSDKELRYKLSFNDLQCT
jgi:hypothetical protein